MPIVTIYWYEGRTDKQKEQIAGIITDALVQIGKTDPEKCEIIFENIRRSDWAKAGRLQKVRPNSPRGA